MQATVVCGMCSFDIKLSQSTKQIKLRDQRTNTELTSPRNIAHHQAPDYINNLLSLKTESNSSLVLTVSFVSSQSQVLHNNNNNFICTYIT